MERARAERPSRASRIAPAAVVVALLSTVLGGFAVAGLLAEPAGAPVGFDGLVLLRPLTGWTAAGNGGSAGWSFARITRGTGNMDVAVRPGATDATGFAAAVRYVDEVLRGAVTRLTVSDEISSVTLGSGLPAVRFTYTGVVVAARQPIEGEVTVVASISTGPVVFDAWTPEGQLPFALGDVHAMIDTAEVA